MNPLRRPSCWAYAALGLLAAPTGAHADPTERYVVAEEQVLEIVLDDRGADRLFVSELPPGATFDPATLELRFEPDFTQGGESWFPKVTRFDGGRRFVEELEIDIVDSIRPPAPRIASVERYEGYRLYVVEQVTDDYLDSAGYAGRSFFAHVTVPDGEGPYPVAVRLHGIGTKEPPRLAAPGEIHISPHDPMNSYWWGYGETLPGPPPSSGLVPDYTVRRVLHLLAWTQRTFESADRERTYISGSSMGGAGAATIGLLHAQYFAWVQAFIGQKIPRNHRPARVEQLTGYWGAPRSNLTRAGGLPVWDEMDLTRVLLVDPASRDQFLSIKHSKDDRIVHFGAVVHESPKTGVNFYEALQLSRVGHYAIWDEGGHGTFDPVMGHRWWHSSWNPITDEVSYLRRDLAFPAFSGSSADDDPGRGAGNGTVEWHEKRGFSGDDKVSGDTGWEGDLWGLLNRFLRWDSEGIVDTETLFEVPLHVLDGDGRDPPKEGFPSRGDQLDKPLPVTVDVTIRRAQRFVLLPGEKVRWRFGPLRGEIAADEDGVVTIPALPLESSWKVLVLERRL